MMEDNYDDDDFVSSFKLDDKSKKGPSGLTSPLDYGIASKQDSPGLPNLNKNSAAGDDRSARSGLFQIAPSQSIADNERQTKNMTANREDVSGPNLDIEGLQNDHKTPSYSEVGGHINQDEQDPDQESMGNVRNQTDLINEEVGSAMDFQLPEDNHDAHQQNRYEQRSNTNSRLNSNEIGTPIESQVIGRVGASVSVQSSSKVNILGSINTSNKRPVHNEQQQSSYAEQEAQGLLPTDDDAHEQPQISVGNF